MSGADDDDIELFGELHREAIQPWKNCFYSNKRAATAIRVAVGPERVTPITYNSTGA
jgi:hypothetical protein